MSAKTLTNRRKSVGDKKKDKKVEIQTEGARQRKENTKKLFNKQNIETKTNQNVSQQEQSLQMEEKPRKANDLELQSFKLEECIQIKWLSLERGQLQRKREDLLKRNVEDWDMIQKGRSAYRELRSLNN